MTFRRILLPLAPLTVLATGPAAFAQTSVTAPLNVTLTIEGECTIAGGTLAFPTSGVLTTAVDAESALTVQCTAGTPYTVELNGGSGVGGTPTTRVLTSAAGGTVTYSLYTNAARTTVWGTTADGATVSGTGTGGLETLPVYGRVPPQATAPAAGAYADVVTATIIYE